MFHLSQFSENLMSFLGWFLEVLSALSISILTHVDAWCQTSPRRWHCASHVEFFFRDHFHTLHILQCEEYDQDYTL